MNGKFSMRLCGKSTVHLWLILLIFSLGSVADVMAYAYEGSRAFVEIPGLICFAFFKATAITASYVFLVRYKWMKIAVMAFIAGYILLSFINGICWLFYGFGVTRKLVTIFAETNVAEISEFLPELWDRLLALLSTYSFWMLSVIFLILWKVLPIIPRKSFYVGISCISALGLLYFFYVLVTADFGKANHIMYVRTYRCVSATIRDRSAVRELMKMRRDLPFSESAISSRRAEMIVVVIGESASRDHLSIYGYPLPTTPSLDSISEGLFRFDDVVASSTSTAQNMTRLLTFMTDVPTEKEWYDFPTIIQLFHQLGYRAYWLSNQENSGEWSNLSGIISGDADVVKYLGSVDSEDHYLYRHDDVLLPAWRDVLESRDTLQIAFLHMMGSHFQYDRRFPHDRSKFTGKDVMNRIPRKWVDGKKAEIIANYDNSILYSDSILGNVIEGIRSSAQPSVLIYVSDHGENVYDDSDYRGRDPKFVRVPFLIYVNEAYQNSNPDIMQDLRKSVSRSFSSSELPHILMHISGSQYSLYDSISDPLADSYRKRVRFVDDEPFFDDKEH